MSMGSKVVLESPGSSEHNEEEESPDMDMDYLDDYDSDEERRSHRKKKRVSRIVMCGIRTCNTLYVCTLASNVHACTLYIHVYTSETQTLYKTHNPRLYHVCTCIATFSLPLYTVTRE